MVINGDAMMMKNEVTPRPTATFPNILDATGNFLLRSCETMRETKVSVIQTKRRQNLRLGFECWLFFSYARSISRDAAKQKATSIFSHGTLFAMEYSCGCCVPSWLTAGESICGCVLSWLKAGESTCDCVSGNCDSGSVAGEEGCKLDGGGVSASCEFKVTTEEEISGASLPHTSWDRYVYT